MSYKKWIYKYKYLKFELEEVNELNDKYLKNFNSKFTFKDKKELPTPVIPEEEFSPKKVKKNKEKNIKDLYKKLSKELHPDKGGNENEFNKLNELYESNDYLGMTLKAEELNLDIPNIQENFNEENFNNLCQNLQNQIEHIKSTLAWKWANATEQEKNILLQLFEQQHGVVLRETM